jgi:hypothetical protein
MSNNPYESSAYAASSPMPAGGQGPPPSGMGIASMVLGIVSIFTGTIGFCCCPYLFAPLTFVCALIGLILGYLGMREAQSGFKSGYGMALAGMICSGIAILIGIVSVLVIAGLIAVSAAAQPGQQNFNFNR